MNTPNTSLDIGLRYYQQVYWAWSLSDRSQFYSHADRERIKRRMTFLVVIKVHRVGQTIVFACFPVFKFRM